MEQMEEPILDAIYGGAVNFTDNGAEAESFKHRVDEIFVKVDKLEQRVNEIEQSSKKQPNACKSSSTVKDKDKHIPSMKKQQQDAACREAASAKRMQELMRHFGTILRQEKRLEEEEAEAQLKMQLAEEAARAKMARDLSNELYEVDMHLEELREMVVQKCRKMSTEEKRKLGVALTRLSPEDLSKALDIVAQNNPGFQATADEVDLDIDAQTESTLWRLKFFVKDAIEVQGKSSASMGGNTNTNTNNHNSGNKTNNNLTNATNKRKREISDAIVKTAKKKNKKPSP
ncbi:hypothetical protein PRUPE_2G216800 [Prunus persica]|uniref:NET domain-containing protein n=1 Tax=Prunus persica TaxID=3760 RepID=A0A251QJS6_PRUPE|nr:hypothetical protein PRUPE_2G216800 [Prunus persica]